MAKYPERDVNILMGDFNAKIGQDNTGYEEVMGRHGLGEISGNGERFADFCAMNNLVIGGNAQRSTQGYLDITRSSDRKSN